jgi:hypothetical protein
MAPSDPADNDGTQHPTPAQFAQVADEIEISDSAQLSAVSPTRLAVTAPKEVVEALLAEPQWKARREIAADWQSAGGNAELAELGATPETRNRFHEIFGCAASAGEQLALAVAAQFEVALWEGYRANTAATTSKIRDRAVAAAHEMCHRAMAEQHAHFLIGTAHQVTNVVGRTIALDHTLHPSMRQNKKLNKSDFPPHSDSKADWLSFNWTTIKELEKVAKASTFAASATTLVSILVQVLADDAWERLLERRGVDFHRRRPQSHGVDGVSMNSPWEQTDTTVSLSFPGTTYCDGDGLAQLTGDLAQAAHETLSAGMKTLLPLVEEATLAVRVDKRKATP